MIGFLCPMVRCYGPPVWRTYVKRSASCGAFPYLRSNAEYRVQNAEWRVAAGVPRPGVPTPVCDRRRLDAPENTVGRARSSRTREPLDLLLLALGGSCAGNHKSDGFPRLFQFQFYDSELDLNRRNVRKNA